MKKLIQKILPVADIILMPLTYPAAWLLKIFVGPAFTGYHSVREH